MERIGLDQIEIDQVFENTPDSNKAAIGLFKLVYPNWDDIEHVNGYVQVSRATNEYLFNKFAEYHGLKGATLWMNWGFGSTTGITEEWVADPAPYKTKE